MAEARSEEDEENMRETREQVVRRQANSSGGRPDRRKPEHRHSQGPLSSIRAAIKRTSNRTTSLSETPPRERDRDRERERERDRDRDRDRRRPEITILSAEPLSSTPWFPGAGFPPPPPPAAQIWGPTISPSVQEIQPPPSYEEVIREKTQEQVIVPSPSSRPPSLSPQLSVSKTTIATQTDTGATQESADPHVRRPLRPPRPSLPGPSSKPFKPDNSALDQSPSSSLLSNGDAASSNSTQTPSCDLLPESSSSSPLTSSGAPQTDQWDGVSASNSGVQQRPRPRPRSKINLQPIGNEVKVQTLVKLREDGLKTLAARARADDEASNREASGGKYLQELLEAFSSDDWGFPEQRSASQSESEDEQNQEVNEEQEEEEDEDMATLRARIQAFEQMHDGNLGGEAVEPCVPTKPRPEPKPRPRVQQNKPPTVAPKPKNITSPKPSCKGFWEDSGQSAVEPEESETNTKQQTEEVLLPQAVKSSEKPSVSPKPQINVETTNTNAAPVPAPRPCPPPAQPKLPPRPTVTPRASRGPAQDRGPSVGQTTPPLPPRPAVDIRTRAKTETANGEERNGNVKVGSSRPSVPSKPASLTSPRRASAPSLDSNRGPSPDPSPVPSKPIAQPPSRPGPAPALRRAISVQSSSDPPLPPRPTGVKLLPLRPPPIKSLPGRPPPPSATSSSNQTPSLKKSPSASSLQSDPTSVSTNQTSKKGPPLPPRPKPGHPLYNSCKQEVLIVLDDPSPAPSEPNSQSGDSTAPAPVSALLIDSTQCLLDLDTDLEPVLNQDQTKPALEGLSETQSILPVEPVEQKEQPEPATISGPRCVALFDYEAVEEDELTFSQGDVISLLELIGRDWGRGQLHKRTGIFPLNFTETVEPLPAAPPTGETNKTTPTETTNSENTGPPSSTQNQDSVTEEWAVAVYDFPGQAEEDLSFQKGALIRVLEHIDAEWRRGRVDDREGLYPAAFTQTTTAAQPITAQQSEVKAKALFNFTAENEDELTLKVGDILTQVESVGEQWILGVVGGKRGIVPKNYISILS